MIIGSNQKQTIKNIKNATQTGNYYAKVETGDPILTEQQKNEITSNFLKRKKSVGYKVKSAIARATANIITREINKNSEIISLENASCIHGGAIITCNHFSPFDNTTIRHLVNRLGKKRLYTVSHATNLAMKGFLGFLMNYADIIPISSDIHYTHNDFYNMISEILKKGGYVLIYPEQEMWFNYKKPRPPKPGAYYYASKLNVPIISCFVEMCELPEKDNELFNKTRYKIHVLEPIFPNPDKSQRENCRDMQKKDRIQKQEAYEKAYGKPLDYTFSDNDIAGWKGKTE